MAAGGWCRIDMTAANDPVDARDPVMQPRCVYCKREQWVIIVASVSLGEIGCAFCGRIPPVFTSHDQYCAALWNDE